MKNPMNDKDFLKELDLQKNKEMYIKIYSLSFDEEPREEIQGKVTSGSINIDGTSAVRRTCSLSLVADDININDYLWVLNTKIRIYIGVTNNINNEYDDIIWFNQGLYILTSFNVTYNTNSYIINISGQDKMCLLNGTVEGILPASIDFKQSVIDSTIYEEVDLGDRYIPEMYQIIDRSEITLDTADSITEDRDYLIKHYKEFEEISMTEKKYVKNKYYIYNPTLFIQLTIAENDTFSEIIKQYPNIYILEDGEYEQINLSNMTAFDKAKTYYVPNNFYVKITSTDTYDEFGEYYDSNYKEIRFDASSFNTAKTTDKTTYYLLKNEYILCSDNNYDSTKKYYTLKEGYYDTANINSITYVANKYYYNKVITYNSAPTEFNKELTYFDLEENKIDFFEKAYNLYKSNKYYIKNALGTEFIKYPYEYNPSLVYYEKKVYSDTEDIPIKTIIKEAVHTYGKEPYYNIIINDVDDEGLLLKEYIGDEPLYLLVNNGICENISNADQICYVVDSGVDSDTISLYIDVVQSELELLKTKLVQKTISNSTYNDLRQKILQVLINGVNAVETTIDDEDTITYNTFIDDFDLEPSKIIFIEDELDTLNVYTVLKLEKGDAAGYELTDLTYPGELISSAGDTLTTILDKIKDTLSNFEYFYDVEGRFVFQKKKTYLNTSWNNIINSDDETYVTSAADVSESQYTFDDNELIVSIGNTVKLDNLKNDYSLWGTRKTINDTEIPIHARYAIDVKPYAYVTFPKTSFNYVDQEESLEIKNINGLEYLVQDIYINLDYFDTIIDDLELILDEDEQSENLTYNYYKMRINPTLYDDIMYAGIYYNIISCDWREIIYQMALDYYKHNQENDFLAKLTDYNTFNVIDEYSTDNEFMKILDNNAGKLYPEGTTGYEQYYTDMEAYWRDIYNPDPEIEIGYTGGYYSNKEWQEVIEDYSQFNCDYYLPTSLYDQYADLLNQSINDYELKISDLEEEIEAYNDYMVLTNLNNQLKELNTKLAAAKTEKNKLLKSYYTQKLFVFNDSEYRKLLEEYNKLETERNEYVSEIETQILSILKNDFELY